MVNGGSNVAGGPSTQSGSLAPKGKRFLSALVDLLAVPILLGIVAGLILIAVPEGIRNVILIAINIGWLLFLGELNFSNIAKKIFKVKQNSREAARFQIPRSCFLRQKTQHRGQYQSNI